MYLSCKMNRTFAMNRIPTGRVGKTVKLRIETDFTCSILNRDSDHALSSFPCRAARSSPDHSDVSNLTIFNLNLKLGGTKPVTVFAKTNLPWKAASGGRGQGPFRRGLLA